MRIVDSASTLGLTIVGCVRRVARVDDWLHPALDDWLHPALDGIATSAGRVWLWPSRLHIALPGSGGRAAARLPRRGALRLDGLRLELLDTLSVCRPDLLDLALELLHLGARSCASTLALEQRLRLLQLVREQRHLGLVARGHALGLLAQRTQPLRMRGLELAHGLLKLAHASLEEGCALNLLWRRPGRGDQLGHARHTVAPSTSTALAAAPARTPARHALGHCGPPFQQLL